MIEEKQQRPTSPQNIVRQRHFSCGFGNSLPCCHGYAKAGLKWLLYWHLGWGLTTRLHHFLYCLPLPLLQEGCKHPAWLLGIVAVPSLRLGQSSELLLPPPASLYLVWTCHMYAAAWAPFSFSPASHWLLLPFLAWREEEEIRTQTHREDHVRTEGEDSHLQVKKRSLRTNQPCKRLDLDSQPSDHKEINFSCLNHSVWYFLMAALRDDSSLSRTFHHFCIHRACVCVCSDEMRLKKMSLSF
uniref:uncharacterized protein LOC106994423 isoform X1 n=1 Tax=Macaca mulatta TaxID=9544 RepID=UPI0010A241AA|nr:uncharacterized protein LOC106994423 isoform X1 [Macaca mulatta]